MTSCNFSYNAEFALYEKLQEFDFSDERMVDSIGLALPKIIAWNWFKIGKSIE